MSQERLQKLLARAGIGSRRACEEIIQQGRVTVDGRVVTELGTKVDPTIAEIRVDGSPVEFERHRYIMLHKPAGYLSNPDRRAGGPSWQDLVKATERLFPVGRLDRDSEGLLLLTNDGELAGQLMHPRHEHAKTYLVQVVGVPNARKIRRLEHGVMLEDGRTAPAKVVLLREPPAGLDSRMSPSRLPRPERSGRRSTSWLRVTLREGRKRQLRRMVGRLGHPAQRVIRIGLGPLELGSLSVGKWRELTSGEVSLLQELARCGRDSEIAPAGQVATGSGRMPKDDSALASRPTTRGRVFSKVATDSSTLPLTIAIDGPSASGKSTIGRLLAQDLGYLYFDTGVMYRAIAAVALARGISLDDESAITALAQQVRLQILPPGVADGRDVTVLADGSDISWDIRWPTVERVVSVVSAYRGVREALRTQQRQIGLGGRVIMVGRDIGTVVLPEADLKIYLDAALRVRAQRRYLERQARGESANLDEVMASMKRRDEIDSSREHAPLSAAPDAVVVDTTGLTVDQVMDLVRSLVKSWARKRPKTLSAGGR